MMVDSVQNLIKTSGYFVEVPQGKFALVQLLVKEDFIDNSLDESFDASRCGVFKRPRRGFH